MKITKKEAYSALILNSELGGDEIFLDETQEQLLKYLRKDATVPISERANISEPHKPTVKSPEDILNELMKHSKTSRIKENLADSISSLAELNQYVRQLQFYNDASRLFMGQGQTIRPDIMFIGMKPTASNQEIRRPFAEDQEKLIDSILEKMLKIHHSLCYFSFFDKSSQNKTLFSEQRNILKQILELEISLVKPKLILVLGKDLGFELLGVRDNIEDVQQETFVLYGITSFLTFHPKELIDTPTLRHLTVPLFKKMAQALEESNK
jgi:uracil-DNA glycosylase family 4